MSSRQWVVCAGVVLVACFMATPSAAQCQVDVSTYADGEYGEYNGNGEADLSYWGNGYDYSSCSPYVCLHEWDITVTVSLQPEQQVMAVVYGTYEAYSSVWVEPATYTIDVEFLVWCHCANDYVANVFAQRVVQVPAPVCAVPTNFRQTSAQDIGGGVLRFVYAWDSSTGNLGHLSCDVGEQVDYPQTPWPPPFPPNNPPNPTILNVPGSDGGLVDTHSTGAPSAFRQPYSETSFVASQIYRYSCSCANGGQWTTVMGPHSITRSVDWVAPNNTWWFYIDKTGSSASMQLP